MPALRPSRLHVLALVVFALALAPRLVFLGADLFHTDSVFQARAVESWVLRGDFAYMHRPGYPGQVLLAAPVFWLHHALTGATSAAFAVTLQSALSGALAAGLAVVFARPFLKTDAGAAAAGIVVAALPTLLSTTTFAMSHGTQAVLLLVAGIAAERRRTWLASAVLGLAVATRTESVLVAPALLLLAWRDDLPLGFDRSRGVHLRVAPVTFTGRLAAFALPVLLVPLALYAKQFADVGLVPWREASADTGWLGPISPMTPLAFAGTLRTLTWPGLALAVWGTFAIWRRDRVRAVVVALWCVVPFAFVANTQIVVPRHLIVALAVLALPIAAALEAPLPGGRATSAVLLAGLVTWMVAPLVPTLQARAARCAPAEFAREVARRTPEDAVVLTMDLSEHVAYFSGRRTLSHDALDGSPADADRVAASMGTIGALVEQGVPVYVTSDAFAYDAPDPTRGVVKVEIGGGDDGRPGGQEAVGRWGIALLETFALDHVTDVPYDDWHGASLGPRPGAAGVASLYRVRPENE